MTMKRVLRTLLLTAVLLSLIASCAAAQTVLAAEEEPDYGAWEKYAVPSGRMTIRTRYLTPGILVFGDEQETVYLDIYEDYEGFFFQLSDADGNLFTNQDETEALDVECTLFWRFGEEDESTEVFHETQTPGDSIIPLTSSERGISGVGVMQNALDPRTDPVLLRISYPGGQDFCFEIPKGSNYDEIWSVASDFWYFPTYDDELYTGSGANPDLIEFLNAFYYKMNEAFEEAKDSGAPMASEALMAKIRSGEDPELTRLYNQYQLLMEHTGGLRTVDYEQIEIVSNWYTQTILAQDVQDGLDVWSDVIDTADELDPLVRAVFGDFVGDSYDDTVWILDGLLDLLN